MNGILSSPAKWPQSAILPIVIKAILFDFDDTLIKTKEIRHNALKDAGKTFYKIDITDKEIDKYWGQPFNKFMSTIFRNLDTPEKLTENFKLILHKYPLEQLPKTSEILEDLSKKYVLAVISSSDPDLISSGMGDTKIDQDLFFFIQSSLDTDVHKPNSEVFLPALERLKTKHISITEIVYVGDTIDDYLASKNAGLYFCGITNHTDIENKFVSKNIPYITSIEELPDFVTNIAEE